MAHRGLGESHGRGGHGVCHSPAAHSLGVSPVSSEARVGAFTCAHLHRFPTAGCRAGGGAPWAHGSLREPLWPLGISLTRQGTHPATIHRKVRCAPLPMCDLWGLLWARGGEGVGCGLSQGAGPFGQHVPQGTSQRGMAGAQPRDVLSCGPPAGLSSSPQTQERPSPSLPLHRPPSVSGETSRRCPAQSQPLCLARPRFSRVRQAARLRPPGGCLGRLFRPG